MFRRPLRLFFPALALVFFLFALSHLKGSSQFSPATESLQQWLGGKSPYYSTARTPYYSYETETFFPPLSIKKSGLDSDLCSNFPTHLLQKIQVVLKTGSGEPSKNSAHISSVTSCITNLLVFSDLEEQNGKHRFIDILADLPASYAVNNSDFEAYDALKKAQAGGHPQGYSKAGWHLDRFKFLPMIEKAYDMNPDADWYVFIETDVYYFWDTLFRLLSQLDPNRMHYMGSPTPGSYGRVFAYGGAGTVMSRALIKAFIGDNPANRPSVQYEQWIKNDCCGDAVLGYAIEDKTATKLEALYPIFAGDEIKGVKTDKERWCIPLLALHRVQPEQMQSLWEWERTRPYSTKAFVHSNFLGYTHKHLKDSPVREYWDNLSDMSQPTHSPSHASLSACESACSKDHKCLQYSYSERTCRFGHFIQLGNSVEKGDRGEFTSGWDLEKMTRWGFKADGNMDDACQEATWLRPAIRVKT